MTKKDYELIAKSIGWTIEDSKRRLAFDTKALDYYTEVIIEMLQAQNPKFDKGLFLTAVQFYSTTN